MRDCDRRAALKIAAAAGAAALLGSRPRSAAAAETLTLYNGQHPEPTAAIVSAFTAATGVQVAIRRGNSAQLANQIIEEGEASPADVFYSEETGPVSSLARRGLLAPLPEATLSQVAPNFAARDRSWIGISARCRVIAYNTDLIRVEDLPQSVMDVASPAWKGRVGFVPTSGEFQAQTLAIVKLKGRDAALDWLKGLKANGRVYNGNAAAIQAVQRREIPIALVNNYYWFSVADEIGEENMKAQLHYLGRKDPGALVTLSAAAALKSSRKPELAQRFVAFMTSQAGQKALVEAVAEYPVRADVASPFRLKPLAELDPPDVTPEDIADADLARDLRREAGLA